MIPPRTSDGPPKAYILDLAADEGVDLSAVTAAKFKVRIPRTGKVVEWTAATSNQSATAIRLTYAYPDTNVFPESGDYSIYAELTTPEGKLLSWPRKLRVLDAFDVST
jgi:hypothetical protein